MGMRLDEAIQRYNDNAEYERAHSLQGCLEFRQLAKWLEELRAYRTMYHAGNVDNCLNDHHKQNIEAFAHDFGVSEEQAEKELRVTTKNDLGVDCISRKAVLGKAKSYNADGWDMYTPLVVDVEDIEELPSVTPQEPRCKECRWWKDSDGKYRRGIGAESKCPLNTHAVYCGEGYCYMFSPKAYREVEE